jgi:putative ABC transport system substrate-binding protein
MRRREFIAGLGSAAAWPVVARAQQPAMPVIGYLSGAAETSRYSAPFLQGLGEHGFVEGRNVEIVYRYAKTQYDRLPAMAAELVGRRVAVIVATGGPNSALAAKSATSTIPIVFESGVDPVESGLVPSLNRPGGNLTGVSFLTTALVSKRLELLHQIVPPATSIGYLVNPTLFNVETQKREAEIAARILGVGLVFLNASTLNEIEAAFAILVGQQIGALMADADPFFFAQRDQIAALATRHAVPAIYAYREAVAAGGLVSYGASILDAYRLVGTYAGRILKGEKPANLPVQQATRTEMVINLKTAKALGLTMPETLLATADEVIQ